MSYQVSSLHLDTNNLSSREWLLDVGDDTTVLSIPLDASDNGLFTGNFVPPPPRPLFLEEGVTPDGLTTCDLCSWAWQNGNSYAIDATASLEPSSELGWVLTLVIVSLTSAVLGAIVMIIVLHCRRLKNPNNVNGSDQEPCSRSIQPPIRPPINTPDDKIVVPNVPYNQTNMNGVWSWLSRRSATTPSQLENPPISFVENHYTHMEDPYNTVDDALYAELDAESTINRDPTTYQNSAYTDSDAPTSSAPSSAYYSDLSVATAPDRAYEVVGLATMPVWESETKKGPIRLAVISETVNVPSDYV